MRYRTLLAATTFGLSIMALGCAGVSAEGSRGTRELFVAPNGDDGGPGTFDAPWATVNRAANEARAGDSVMIRGGYYALKDQVRVRNSGRADAWIMFKAYRGEAAILDANAVLPANPDNGAVQIEGVSYIQISGLAVINSHNAGFTIRDSSHIDIINNSTKGSFSSGINVWDTNHDDHGTEHIRILGNTISRATTREMAPVGASWTPHEALSIGGAVDFEVAYNHVYDSDKEGIDIKETSKRGIVHHNLVHNLPLQCLYVDAWFGSINGIEIYSNVIHNCHGAGLVLSVEEGQSVEDINIHNNIIFNNDGSGLLFSRWGANSPRRNIRVIDNIFYHNGYGSPAHGQSLYWITGGIYLYTANMIDVLIQDNVFSENKGFQIGYSELLLQGGRSWEQASRDQKIRITGNRFDHPNPTDIPIRSGGMPADQVLIYATDGELPRFGNPMFKDPTAQDFSTRDTASDLWWKSDFPPKIAPTK
jgi:hypothetical protein